LGRISDTILSTKSEEIDETDGLETEDEEREYCYHGCDTPYDSAKMLRCAGEDCEQRWFHFECAGIEKATNDKK